AAGATVPPPPSEDEARRQASEILRGGRYHPAQMPKPFKGVLDVIGRLLRPVLEPIGRLLAPIWEHTAGKVLLASLVVALSAFIVFRIGARRLASSVDREARAVVAAGDDPD